ncbi:MAG: cytochrome P450, partial [Pseudomonadota bacterium]
DAAQFDDNRANAADHMAFGYGPHVCLGKRVANMQLEAALKAILSRFPKITTTGDIDIAPSNFVHAISRLGVSLTG